MIEFSVERPLAIVVAAVLALVGSFAGARIAMQSGALLDDPNDRSSHDHAVSRAGGLAILAGLAAGLFTVAAFAGGAGLSQPAWSFLLLALLAGGVGLADDRMGLSPAIKFAGQFFVALLFVWLLGPLKTAPAPFVGNIDLGAFGVFITMFWIVGFMNAFNFMDGVNGIAAGAAATGLSLFAVVAAFASAPAAAVIAGLVALAALGFLPANVMRARLFMGDCGSHLLGFMIAGLGVFAANASEGRASALIIPMIFLPFLFDVAFTLAHRFMRKQNVVVAHREHIYQLLVRSGARHSAAALLYCGLTGFCAAGAILMLTIAPAWAWTAPAAASLVFLLAGLRVFKSAEREGLLSGSAPSGCARERRRDEIGERG